MRFYDRYGSLLPFETASQSVIKSDVNYQSSSLLYTDEGQTAKTGVLYNAPYYYTDVFDNDTELTVTIEGTPSTHTETYSAFYEYVGELISGQGTASIAVYNIEVVGDDTAPSANWSQSITMNVKAGRRLAVLFYRPYSEITSIKVDKVSNDGSGNKTIMGTKIPVMSGLLSDELVNFSPLIYNFPQQTDAYVASPTYKDLDISTDDFLALYYDKWVGIHKDGVKVTKQSIGYDETGQYEMWEYDFCPESYTYLILLTSGLHPYELSASFGLAWFMKRFMEVVDGEVFDEGFAYLINHVRIKCVPILNPWGFNQNPKTYGNVHGVNINRNVTFKWPDGTDAWSQKPSEPDSEWEWKGTAPFSEQETKNIRAWVTENQSATLWIDCHADAQDARYDVYALFRNTYVDGQLSVYSSGAIRAQNALVDHIRTKYGKANPTVAPRTESLDTKSMDYGITNYAQNTYGTWQNTVEQSPASTTWGTASNNEGSDITEYAISIYAYLLGSLPHNVDAKTWILSLFE